MSIINIKNVYVRRITLVVLILPITLFASIFFAGKAVLEVFADVLSQFAGTWKGR